MNKLKINYKQLGSYADYAIKQETTLVQNGEVLSKNEQLTNLAFDIVSISSTGAVTARIKFGDVAYVECENPTPPSIKEYVNILSQVLKTVELRIDTNGQIIAVENVEKLKKEWEKVKGEIFKSNEFFSSDEKKDIINSVTELFSHQEKLIKEIQNTDYLKFLLADFYGKEMKLGEKEILEDASYESIALSNFAVKLKMNRYLESISIEKNECEISVYGILDANVIDYKALAELTDKELKIENFESYNYFVDILYVVDIQTGLIKSEDIEIEETFNENLIFKVDRFICML